MSTSGFLYRDILKYVIPTLLLLLLIVPLFESSIDYKVLIPFGIIISLIIGPLLAKLSTFFYKIFPKVREVISISNWMNSNWNYRKMFYNISKDDRDYLYLTGAYVEFFKNSGLVIFIYMVVTIILMIVEVKGNYSNYLTHSTIVLSSLEVNTFFILIICIILINTLKAALIFETKILLFPDGQFEIFAEKVQRENNELIARKIYGKIDKLQGIEVNLYHQNKLVSTCSTNQYGYWNFDLNDEYLDSKLKIIIVHHSQPIEREIEICLRCKPYFDINL